MAYSSAEELTLIYNILDEITIELKSTVKNGNFKTENGKIVKSLLDEFSKGMLDRLVKIVDEKIKAGSGTGKFLFPKYSKRKFERTSRRKTETKRCFG